MSPSLLQIIILGIIQGAAELLPVSSSAHVIVAEKLMGLDPSSPEMTFLLAMLHTGTMAAMIVYFWKAWRQTFFSSPEQFAGAAFRVILATAASGGLYLALEFVLKKTLLSGHPGAEVEDLFSNLRLIAAALAAGGVLIAIAGLLTGAPGRPARPLTPAAALGIGLAQGLALPFRGLSRSGSTISVGMLAGVHRRACEEFSFALAVVITPPVIARELHRFAKARAAGHAAVDWVSLATPGLAGMFLSFVAGLLALRWISGWLENGRWHYFGFYCLAAAALVFAFAARGF
ncbi:MAG TPA: undecaprenyl-diphosphate phosphatase [Opitutaceae bacterium]